MSNVDQLIDTFTNKGNQSDRGKRRKWNRKQCDPIHSHPSNNQKQNTMSKDCPIKHKCPVKINRNTYSRYRAIQLENTSIVKPRTQVEAVPDTFTLNASIKRSLDGPPQNKKEATDVIPKKLKLDSPETFILSSPNMRKLDEVPENDTDANEDATHKRPKIGIPETYRPIMSSHKKRKLDVAPEKKLDATDDVTHEKTKTEIPEIFAMSSPKKRKLDVSSENKTDATEHVTHDTKKIESPHQDDDFDTLDFVHGIHTDLMISKLQDEDTVGMDFLDLIDNGPPMTDEEFDAKLEAYLA